MRISLLSFLFPAVLFFSACRRSETIEPHKDKTALYQRFHGRYKPIQSLTGEAVDLNRDGTASIDLLKELPFQNAELEIRIQRSFTLYQQWPEAYLSYGIPDSTVNYANQGPSRLFQFDKDIRELIILPDDASHDPVRFPLPQSVLIKSEDHIEITMHKRLYTASGWKIIKTVTLYKRYTMTT